MAEIVQSLSWSNNAIKFYCYSLFGIIVTPRFCKSSNNKNKHGKVAEQAT
jgi:hypothetical protein